MPTFDLVTAGDAFEDFVFAGLPRLPRAGEELKTPTLVRAPGGGVIITAVAAARLGLRCEAIGAFAPDAARCLARERVRVANVIRRGETPAITIALSTDRNRSFVTFAGVNDRIEPRLMRAVRRVSARHLHFALQPARCRPWIPILLGLRARGITTSWDFGWSEPLARDRGLPRLAASVDYLFLNAQESKLYGCIRATTTIVKLGARGARLVSADASCAVAAPRVRVVDTTGAGDAFNAGFLFALLRGESPRECMRIASAVAAQSTRAAGGLDGLPRRVRA
jgi:sugar/nucleoside kinase (ribokinase family)